MYTMLARGFFAGTILLAALMAFAGCNHPRPAIAPRREDDIKDQVWEVLAEARKITEEAS